MSSRVCCYFSRGVLILSFKWSRGAIDYDQTQLEVSLPNSKTGKFASLSIVLLIMALGSGSSTSIHRLQDGSLVP